MRTIILMAFVLVAQMARSQTTDYEWGIDQVDSLRKGLVSYWSMRSVGSAVPDEYGANAGVLSNGASSVNYGGIVSDGLRLDGTNDILAVSNNPDVNMSATSAFSFSAWIRSTRATGNDQSILRKQALGGDAQGYLFVLQNSPYGRVLFQLRQSSATNISKSTQTQCSSNKWHHVAVTYSGVTTQAGIDLFLDGQYDVGPVSTGTVSAITNTEQLGIGGSTTLASRNFAGNIDEVRVYNRALSAAEVKQLYRMGATIYQNRSTQ